MATDKSEPRVGLILKIGALASVTLIATHAALVTYFDHVAHGEEFRKIASVKPEALQSARADEMQRLTGGPMPIDRAVQMLATHGRTGVGTEMMPKASKDMAPLQGWVQMPGEVPAAMTASSAEAAPVPGAGMSLDAGAAAPASSAAGRDQDAGSRDGAAPKHSHKAP